MIHELPLFWTRKKLGGSVVAHRHVVEIPDEQRAPIHHLIEIRFAADRIEILTGIAAGDTERQPLLFQKIHGRHHLIKDPLPSAVVRLAASFHRDGGMKFFTRSISSAKSSSISVAFVKERKIQSECFSHRRMISFADQRFSAGINVKISAQIFSPV